MKEPKVLVEILLEIFEGQLVPVLKLPVVVALLLYCIICEVNVDVVQVVGVVLLARCANIPIIVVVSFLHAINRGPQPIRSDVKLPPLY